MTCHEARQHWNLHYDSEGEADLHFQIQEHLEICPECATWFDQQSRLQRMIDKKLAAPAPSPALWSRTLVQTGIVRPARQRRWLKLGSVAACAAALLAIAWWTWLGRSPSLTHLAAERHGRLVAGDERADFSSDSDLAIEGYLRQRVAFPVRCPPRKDAGFAVAGAGVCRLAGQQAAYLTGRVEERPVSIFILPSESLAVFGMRNSDTEQVVQVRVGAYALVVGIKDRNAVVVIGQTESEQLERVLSAYGSYPDHHPPG